VKSERVIIFILIGLMLFSAVATALYFVAQDKPSDDSQADASNADDTGVTCQTPSAEVATYAGSPVGQWPIKVDATDTLKVEDLKAGTGRELKLGDCISVHYRLSLADGTPIEGNDTFALGAPIAFEFVEGGLIKGWTDGLPGLKEGGVRRLRVPPELGYGDTERSGIPPNSTLIFDVELVKIEF